MTVAWCEVHDAGVCEGGLCPGCEVALMLRRGPAGLGHLARIDEARARVDEAKRAVEAARSAARTVVHEAVAGGMTWQQLADHLGVTKQAVHEMYR